jgi:hypothetical protein
MLDVFIRFNTFIGCAIFQPFIKQRANAFSSGTTKSSGSKNNKDPSDAFDATEVSYYSYETETDDEYSSAANSLVFSNRNASKFTAKIAAKYATKSAGSTGNNYAAKSTKKSAESAVKCKASSESTMRALEIPMGSEVQDSIYRALLATDNDVRAAFDLLPEAVRKHRVKTVNELITYVRKTPKVKVFIFKTCGISLRPSTRGFTANDGV